MRRKLTFRQILFVNNFAPSLAGLLHIQGCAHPLLALPQALTLSVAVLGHDLRGHRVPEIMAATAKKLKKPERLGAGAVRPWQGTGEEPHWVVVVGESVRGAMPPPPPPQVRNKIGNCIVHVQSIRFLVLVTHLQRFWSNTEWVYTSVRR